jgi:hypothetical protein
MQVLTAQEVARCISPRAILIRVYMEFKSLIISNQAAI